MTLVSETKNNAMERSHERGNLTLNEKIKTNVCGLVGVISRYAHTEERKHSSFDSPAS
jgi:hypothetical protein